MDSNIKKRIKEIDTLIEGLKKYIDVCLPLGGLYRKFALRVQERIKELELEKDDLIHGTNKLELYQLKKQLQSLKSTTKQAKNFVDLYYNTIVNEAKPKER